MPHFAGGTGNIRASQVLAWRPVAISASSVGPISFIWLKPSKCSVFQLLGNIGRFVKAELVSSPRKNLKLGGFGPAWRAFVLLSSSLHNLRRRNRVSFFLGFVLLSRCRRDGVPVFDRNESGPLPPDPHSPQPAFLLRVSV